jgi:hypothetical protein
MQAHSGEFRRKVIAALVLIADEKHSQNERVVGFGSGWRRLSSSPWSYLTAFAKSCIFSNARNLVSCTPAV